MLAPTGKGNWAVSKAIEKGVPFFNQGALDFPSGELELGPRPCDKVIRQLAPSR